MSALAEGLKAAVVIIFIAIVALVVAEPANAPTYLPPVVTVPAKATSTPVVVVATTSPQVLPTTKATTTTKAKPLKPAPKPTTPPPKTSPVLTLDQAIQSISNLASGQSTSSLSVNDRVRAALVNIICTTEVSGPFESISGSGVIIDPRGVILTNAHVAQFFLLRNYPRDKFVSCVIRTGSPARPMYTAELMFLPPSWVKDNAVKITQETPTGTGERDYALLRITGTVSPSITMPASFPFLLTAVNSPSTGATVLQAGYAAGFLGGITVQNDLFASSAYTTVRDVYTYNANTADLFSLGGSVVAQHGSSGGPVTDTDGVLMGVIVTSTAAADTADRELRALATSYIIRDFENERGKSLLSVLSSNLSEESKIFESIFAPSERSALITTIEAK